MNAGDTIIISTHTIGFYPPASRTGGDIMVRSSRGWKVPSQYSGTIDNNYATRTVDDSLPLMSKEIEDLIRRRM
jgi:hypothetical protein